MRGVPELLVRRDELASCELVDGEGLRDDLADGEAQLLVERFGLSANNITYAVTGFTDVRQGGVAPERTETA